MSNKYTKFIIAIVAGLYFFYYAKTSGDWHFIDNFNLLIHEAGHVIFSPFGEFMRVFGGSLNQVLIPLIFTIYFWFWRQDKFSGSLVLLWVGQNIINVSVYAGDAVRMQLPLITGGNGRETGMHDWNWLLIKLGWLHYTDTVANIMNMIGLLVIVAAFAGSLYYSLKEQNNLKQNE